MANAVVCLAWTLRPSNWSVHLPLVLINKVETWALQYPNYAPQESRKSIWNALLKIIFERFSITFLLVITVCRVALVRRDHNPPRNFSRNAYKDRSPRAPKRHRHPRNVAEHHPPSSYNNVVGNSNAITVRYRVNVMPTRTPRRRPTSAPNGPQPSLVTRTRGVHGHTVFRYSPFWHRPHVNQFRFVLVRDWLTARSRACALSVSDPFRFSTENKSFV